MPSDLLFVALVLAATRLKGWRRPASGLLWVAALPPMAVVVAAVATGTPWAVAGLEVARTTYSMLTLAFVASLPIDDDDLRLAARTWATTITAACLIGILSYAGVVFFGLPPNVFARPNSPNLGAGVVRIAGILHTNTLTLYLVVGAAFAAFQARHATSDRERRFGSATLALLSLTALASASRGAAGFFVALALLARRAELAPAWLYHARATIACLSAILVVLVMSFTLWAVVPVSFETDGAGSPRLRWNERPSAYRVFHTAGLRMFVSNPTFGVGAGRFGTRLVEYTSTKERSEAWPPVRSQADTAAHSTWIGIAAEGGVVLMAAWAVVWGMAAAWLLGRSGSRSDLGPYLGLSLVGLFFSGFFIDLTHLKFVWAGFGLGLTRPVGRAVTERSRDS